MFKITLRKLTLTQKLNILAIQYMFTTGFHTLITTFEYVATDFERNYNRVNEGEILYKR